MRSVVAALVLAFSVVLTPLASAGEKPRPLTVVELFTSQGCSSCPPADAFLGELADRDDLLALSFHVDYWDYIGWKDPFADPAYTDRQRRYARYLGLRYVYTPQMVVHGSSHMTGSDRRTVLHRIDEAGGAGHVPVSLIRTESGSMAVSIAASANGEEAAVWLVVFDERHQTKVKRGENRGRTLVDRNVVRGLKRIATWSGTAIALDVPLDGLTMDPGDGCAVIVQSLADGRVLGAAKLALDGAS